MLLLEQFKYQSFYVKNIKISQCSRGVFTRVNQDNEHILLSVI